MRSSREEIPRQNKDENKKVVLAVSTNKENHCQANKNTRFAIYFIRYGARGLHAAARQGHLSVLTALLARGEDVDCLTGDNFTALHLAVEAGKAQVVEALLGHGAKVHIRVSSG